MRSGNVVLLAAAFSLCASSAYAHCAAPYFTDSILYPSPTGQRIDPVAAADFDGDGRTDVAIGNYAEVDILYANGDGTFTDPVLAGGPYRSATMVVADLNGDGRPDLLVGSSSASTPAAGALVRASHVSNLRSAIDAARANVGALSFTWTYTPVPGFTTIKAAHVQELRDAIR